MLNSSTFSQIATLLSDAGVPAVTRDIVQKAGIRQAAIADTSPPPMLSEDFLVIEYLRRMLPPEAVLAIAAEINEVHIDHSSILLSHAKDQFDSVLKDRADTPSIIEINLNAPNSLEGRLYLAHLNQPEIALPTTPETPSAGANEQTPEAASDTPAETDGTNGAAPTPALSRLTPPVNPRHNSPALTRAMDAIVPVIEARLRRMGVTSKHLRLGRAAAIADDEAEADLSMATLVHALAIREGLPAEFAIAMIAGMVSAAVSASSPQATTTRTTR